MNRRAFTMIELLIAVGLISVLAAIAVPNFLDAQVRSKVARARTDMATLVAAVEHYHADHHAYPPNVGEDRDVLRSARLPTRMETLVRRNRGGQAPMAPRFDLPQRSYYSTTPPSELLLTGFVHLTTPTQYIPPLWGDPFAVFRQMPYSYVNWTDVNPRGLPFHPLEPRTPFLIVSQGPDSHTTIDFPTNIGAELYDPTNGTTSGGDLYEYPR